jgi:hypothetical protein
MSGREESRANHSFGKREIPLGLARWQMGDEMMAFAQALRVGAAA